MNCSAGSSFPELLCWHNELLCWRLPSTPRPMPPRSPAHLPSLPRPDPLTPPPRACAVVDTVWKPASTDGFPGLYCTSLPEQPFLPGSHTLLLTTQWRRCGAGRRWPHASGRALRPAATRPWLRPSSLAATQRSTRMPPRPRTSHTLTTLSSSSRLLPACFPPASLLPACFLFPPAVWRRWLPSTCRAAASAASAPPTAPAGPCWPRTAAGWWPARAGPASPLPSSPRTCRRRSRRRRRPRRGAGAACRCQTQTRAASRRRYASSCRMWR